MSNTVRITEKSRRAFTMVVDEEQQRRNGYEESTIKGPLVEVEFPARALEGTKDDIRGFLIDALASLQQLPD